VWIEEIFSPYQCHCQLLMDNSSTEVTNADLDPISMLALGIWFGFLAVVGIPLNIFIAIATLKVKAIRDIPSNIFIGCLGLVDTFYLLSVSLHFPYALSHSELICKISGGGIGFFALLSTTFPPFLAINRYAVVCAQEQPLARFLSRAFTKKGICLIIFLLAFYQLLFNVPFTAMNSLGLAPSGSCFVLNRSFNNHWLLIYYYCGVIGLYDVAYFALFFFYNRVRTWVKNMSSKLTLTAQTKSTVQDTQNVMKLTKWITIIPFIVTAPTIIGEIIERINPDIIPIRIGRCMVSLYPLYPVFNGYLTVLFATPYRLALRNECKRTKLTLWMYLVVFERKWATQVDVFSGNSAQPIQTIGSSRAQNVLRSVVI
jgi:hypothetical protein